MNYETETYVLGIDLGTQGVRCIVCDLQGNIQAEGRESLDLPPRQGEYFEQDPYRWWEKTFSALRLTVNILRKEGKNPKRVRFLSCDSTSGTVIPCGEGGKVLHPAIMYNDARAKKQADRVNESAQEFTAHAGYRFEPSFALCKVVWLQENMPEIYHKTRFFLHAADWLVGKLTGIWGYTDISNVLKMGYDLAHKCWPSFIENTLGISQHKLPSVVNSGQEIGKLLPEVANETGLEPHIGVVAGATDGTAAFYASGASLPGDVSAALGTTLVVRGVSHNLVRDERGRVYCHRHPEGWWLPGGASNTGGECLLRFFPGEDYPVMDDQASSRPLPSDIVVYPIGGRGERLPFASPHAEFFQLGKEKDRLELYTGCLEGVAYLERYSYELLAQLGATPITRVYTSGSGALSTLWCRIRASVLERPLMVPATIEAAMGSCILAASGTLGGVGKACRSMVRQKTVIEPEPDVAPAYRERYHKFLDACRDRGYID